MQATQDITLSADRRSARRWRIATGLVLVIATGSLMLAVTRAYHVERVPVLVNDVSATRVAITSSAATHEAGQYVPLTAGHEYPHADWTHRGAYLPPTPSAYQGRPHGVTHAVDPHSWEG